MDSVIIKVVSEKAYPCSVVSVQNIMVSSETVSLLACKSLVFHNRCGVQCHPQMPNNNNISCLRVDSPGLLTLMRDKKILTDTKKDGGWGHDEE